jgi:pimeloyl-ACP methyl ester carboxylesterase
MGKSTHPVEVVRIYEKILAESSAEGRYVDIDESHKIHVVETGTGPPLVYLHGTGGPAFTITPILEHLEGIHVIAPDRPGEGLSDMVDVGDKGYRDMAVEVTDRILDALRVDQISLAGSSGGGVWAIWYALANPERVHRLILLGSAPLLPGTRAPLPLRLMVTPVIGNVMARIPANEKTVVQMMGMVGEKETIVNYPTLIEALAASNNDPVATEASRREFSAFMNPFGFKSSMELRTDDLAKLKMPTLVIWGEHDPLGDADTAQAICEAIPNCVLELLPAGHVPYLGHPEKSAKLVSDFVLSGDSAP